MANLLVSWNQLFNCVTFASWLKRVITMQIITDIRMWQLSQRSLFLYFSLTIHHVYKRQKELSLNEFSQVEIYTLDENKIKVIFFYFISANFTLPTDLPWKSSPKWVLTSWNYSAFTFMSANFYSLTADLSLLIDWPWKTTSKWVLTSWNPCTG